MYTIRASTRTLSRIVRAKVLLIATTTIFLALGMLAAKVAG